MQHLDVTCGSSTARQREPAVSSRSVSNANSPDKHLPRCLWCHRECYFRSLLYWLPFPWGGDGEYPICAQTTKQCASLFTRNALVRGRKCVRFGSTRDTCVETVRNVVQWLESWAKSVEMLAFVPVCGIFHGAEWLHDICDTLCATL